MAAEGTIWPAVAFQPFAGLGFVVENGVCQIDRHGGYLLAAFRQVYNWAINPLTRLYFLEISRHEQGIMP
jgi:hypothetical protein